MNEDIKKPDHLRRFPCMCPWIGGPRSPTRTTLLPITVQTIGAG